MKAIMLALAFVVLNLSISWVSQADIMHVGGVPYDNSTVQWVQGVNASNPGANSFLSNIPIINLIPQAQTMFSMLGGLVHALSFDWARPMLQFIFGDYWLVNSILLGMNGLFALLVMYAVLDVLSSTAGRFL